MADDDEAFLLLLLSDGNLPTGSFVASSGLESYVKHGFAAVPIISFLRDSLETYARSALPFVSDAQRVVEQVREVCSDGEGALEHVLKDLVTLDELYHSMTLNHVTRRASQAQGVALLTLYAKGFSRPVSAGQSREDAQLNSLINRLKMTVRRGETHGHLPICWGVLTAALGLSLERSQFLHLFLHARSILSAAVRLNNIGPYAAQQILLHSVRPLVIAETSRCKHLRTGIIPLLDELTSGSFDERKDGPATTWPLGEILAARHDLQHSRIFNS